MLQVGIRYLSAFKSSTASDGNCNREEKGYIGDYYRAAAATRISNVLKHFLRNYASTRSLYEARTASCILLEIQLGNRLY